MAERRDYLERLIQQLVQALAAILTRRKAGEFELALQQVEAAKKEILGPMLPMLERFEPTSAITIAGQERVRAYAALVGEEALLRQASGDPISAALCARRSVELCRALRDAGAQLPEEDLDRLAALASMVAEPF